MTTAVLDRSSLLNRATRPGALPAEHRIPVLLVDPDPISRHVLTGVLRASPRVRLLAAVDRPDPSSWAGTLHRAPRVAVLCPGTRDDIPQEVRALRSRTAGVVVLGARWTRDTICAALAAGAGACLVKEPNAEGLADAVVAVGAGHSVLAPSLLHALVEPSAPGPAADPRAALRVSRLSRREREVLALLAEGVDTAQAARRLCVSTATVKSHVSHSLTKLGVHNRLEAVLLLRSVLE
jgi:two-component system, NarL family, nitrate/nitrite response regulator NarL